MHMCTYTYNKCTTSPPTHNNTNNTKKQTYIYTTPPAIKTYLTIPTIQTIIN